MSIPKGFGTVVFYFKPHWLQLKALRSTIAYILASRKPDDVYGALSAACYVNSTQAAQKVPETKKVDDGVHSVRRGNLMKYTVLYQQPVR